MDGVPSNNEQKKGQSQEMRRPEQDGVQASGQHAPSTHVSFINHIPSASNMDTVQAYVCLFVPFTITSPSHFSDLRRKAMCPLKLSPPLLNQFRGKTPSYFCQAIYSFVCSPTENDSDSDDVDGAISEELWVAYT